jgi:hypothetical protein
MLFLALFALVVCLGVYFLPVDVLRRKASAKAQDYFVASERTPPGVIQNSSIAYSVKMAIFGPFFALGAAGDFWPAIVASASLGLGVYLLGRLCAPLLPFFHSAFQSDQSFTLHEFIAQRHGHDPRVRVLAASLSVFALFGLTVCEAFGVATMLKPVMPNIPYSLILLGMLLLTALYALPAGNSGAMRSSQAQLGAVYLALFGSTALLLYILMATLRRMPPHGTLAVLLVAAICLVVLCYRRSRYVDTSPLETTDAAATRGGAAAGREAFGGRLFRRFNKIINVVVSTLAVFVIVFAGMELYPRGAAPVLSDSAAALQGSPRLSHVGLMALVFLALLYPIMDVANWQRFAALAKNVAPDSAGSTGWAAAVGRIVRVFAIETALVSFFLCMFGAIAVAALRTPGGPNILQTFVQQLASQQNWVAEGALSLLLIGGVMIAVSTMSVTFSAGLCVLHYDILPAFQPEPACDEARPAAETLVRRHAVAAGSALCLVMFAAFSVLAAQLQIDFTGGGFLALVFAFCCAQLAGAPLVLGPMIGGPSRGFAGVSPVWALAVLGVGAAAGMGAAATYLATGREPWLWAAVPACLGAGSLIFAIACLQARRSHK